MNIVVSQSVIDAVPWIVSTLKKMGFPRLAAENCKTGIITAIMKHFRNLSVNMPGYCYYDIPGQKYRLIFRYRMSKDRTKALLTSVSTGERPLHEQKRNIVRLTESDLMRYIKEAASKVLNEAFDFPNGLSPKKVNEKFTCALSRLYQDGKITEDEFNELFHYGMYFNPYYTNGHKEDCLKNQQSSNHHLL